MLNGIIIAVTNVTESCPLYTHSPHLALFLHKVIDLMSVLSE